MQCNAFGDVIAIFNSSKSLLAKYTYDSWGKLLSITNASGTDISSQNNIWTQNSIRYRGYVYDTETKLYYLQSRYYDPETCRFINADSVAFLAADSGLNSYNLYSYCNNNPVILSDPSGEIAITTLILIGSALIGVGTAIFSGYQCRKAGYDWFDTLFCALGDGMCAFGAIYTFGTSAYALYCDYSWYSGKVPVTEIFNKTYSADRQLYNIVNNPEEVQDLTKEKFQKIADNSSWNSGISKNENGYRAYYHNLAVRYNFNGTRFDADHFYGKPYWVVSGKSGTFKLPMIK